MRTGISTACLYPIYTERALALVAEQGFGTVEVFFNAPSELEPGFLSSLKEIQRRRGVDIISIHPYSAGFETIYFFGDYRRRFEDGLELYKKYFNACAEFGAKYVVFHGCVKTKPVPVELYAERLRELGDAARSMGCELLQENVERCLSRDPELIAKLHRLLPEQGFVLDTKQALRSGCRPEAMLEAMGGGLRHVHISDSDPFHDCLPVGEGSADLQGLKGRLGGMGYDGAVIQELYSSGYRDLEQLWRAERRLERLFG